MVKNPPANVGDMDLIPGLGRSPRERNDSPLLYSCLENPTDRGAWWATVRGVTKSQIQFKRLNNNSNKMHSTGQKKKKRWNFNFFFFLLL